MADIPDITLNNGVRIPQLGFGVFQVPPAETAAAVRTALEVGYRHIDTAEMYGNEQGVGEAIRDSGIPQSEIFVTSKLNNPHLGYDAALAGVDASLERLGLEKLDLYLIHWPLPTVRDYVETWKGLAQAYADGKVRAVGVSNFQVAHLQRLLDETDVAPALNQIELHPYLTQSELRSFDAEHGIATEAWSPIAKANVLTDPTVTGIAERIGRTPAQVVLRWHLQLGNVVIPKSVHEDRMRENLALFDFSLSDEDVARIDAMNKDERTGPDPDVFDRIS